jgi:hypothetical protein
MNFSRTMAFDALVERAGKARLGLSMRKSPWLPGAEALTRVPAMIRRSADENTGPEGG